MNDQLEKFIVRSLLLVIVPFMAALMVSCGNKKQVSPASSPAASPQIAQPATGSVAAQNQTIQFKLGDGSAAFSINPKADGAKLVDGKGKELARFKSSDRQKIKIKDAADHSLGFIVTESGYWKIKNTDQTERLYSLRLQKDGSYKLEDGANQQLYHIKVRDYGLEIETLEKHSLYKVKLKDGKTYLYNAQDKTVVYTEETVPLMTVACFGLDGLGREQQAALAYAVNLSGGR
jgi:hypothetical protein